MTQYWLYVNGRLQGPYKPHQVPDVDGFNPQTPVCEDGMDGKNEDWRPAREFDEIREILENKTPSSKGTQTEPDPQDDPKRIYTSTLYKEIENEAEKADKKIGATKHEPLSASPQAEDVSMPPEPQQDIQSSSQDIGQPTELDKPADEQPQYSKEEIENMIDEDEKQRQKNSRLFSPISVLLVLILLGGAGFGLWKAKPYLMKLLKKGPPIETAEKIEKKTPDPRIQHAIDPIRNAKSHWVDGKTLEEYLGEGNGTGNWRGKILGDGIWITYQDPTEAINRKADFWVNLSKESAQAKSKHARIFFSGQKVNDKSLTFAELANLGKKPATPKEITQKKPKPKPKPKRKPRPKPKPKPKPKPIVKPTPPAPEPTPEQKPDFVLPWVPLPEAKE